MASSYAGIGVSTTRARRTRRAAFGIVAQQGSTPRHLLTDPYRHVVFPNNIRDVRLARGQLKLLSFSARMPEIAYIRLSKIERGEVFARADELVRIAAELGVEPATLLIDVSSPAFDMAAWFAPFAEGAAVDDPDEARTALLLAAAVRRTRAIDPQLTATVVNDVFGIAPVVLSRIENAHKGLSRWSPTIVAAIDRLLGDRREPALRPWLDELHLAGELDRFLAEIDGPEERLDRTRQRIEALAAELRGPVAPVRNTVTPASVREGPVRRIALVGVPGPDGTIMLAPTGETMPAPDGAGARAFAVRVGRATLGPGLPAGTIVVVNPDRWPRAGGLALIREGERHRLVAVMTDRNGALTGHSLYPKREIVIDDLDPDSVAAVAAAFFG